MDWIFYTVCILVVLIIVFSIAGMLFGSIANIIHGCIVSRASRAITLFIFLFILAYFVQDMLPKIQRIILGCACIAISIAGILYFGKKVQNLHNLDTSTIEQRWDAGGNFVFYCTVLLLFGAASCYPWLEKFLG